MDVKVKRNGDGSLDTSVYRKSTDTNVYINCNSYAPKEGKIGTLKGLIRRAHVVCSTETGLKNELDFLKSVFRKYNDYPSKIFFNTLRDTKKKIQRENEQQQAFEENNNLSRNSEVSNDTETIHPYLRLPYRGEAGAGIVSRFKKVVERIVGKNVEPRVTMCILRI